MPNRLSHLDRSDEPAYAEIAAAVHADIAAGTLKPGQRLPTHRELADQLGVASGTVMRAYREAERQGLIRSRVGSGTYVLAPDPYPQPHTAPAPPPDAGIIDLSANRPLQHLDPDLSAVLDDLARERAGGPLANILRYTPIEGRDEHRRIAAAKSPTSRHATTSRSSRTTSTGCTTLIRRRRSRPLPPSARSSSPRPQSAWQAVSESPSSTRQNAFAQPSANASWQASGTSRHSWPSSPPG